MVGWSSTYKYKVLGLTVMDHLAEYYIRQGGSRSGYRVEVFGPVYVVRPYVQREHGIGSFLACFFRAT
jgi:hypothetical protein